MPKQVRHDGSGDGDDYVSQRSVRSQSFLASHISSAVSLSGFSHGMYIRERRKQQLLPMEKVFSMFSTEPLPDGHFKFGGRALAIIHVGDTVQDKEDAKSIVVDILLYGHSVVSVDAVFTCYLILEGNTTYKYKHVDLVGKDEYLFSPAGARLRRGPER